ncbi:hypothetical protein [Ectothiorhodospira shaposhnikovii]|nr:hypothetical protein [Ectothiorhodospira shaposhnikovii]
MTMDDGGSVTVNLAQGAPSDALLLYLVSDATERARLKLTRDIK